MCTHFLHLISSTKRAHRFDCYLLFVRFVLSCFGTHNAGDYGEYVADQHKSEVSNDFTILLEHHMHFTKTSVIVFFFPDSADEVGVVRCHLWVKDTGRLISAISTKRMESAGRRLLMACHYECRPRGW
jgi:hypothetical protein